jgi:hypothetical protein
MEEFQVSVKKQLDEHRVHVNQKLTEFQNGDSLAESICDKLSKKRQHQITELRKKSETMVTQHPVAKLLGKCLVDMVTAVELNRPESLLHTLTDVYNAANGNKDPVSPPAWDKELNDLAGLAFGTVDVNSVDKPCQ